MPIEVKELKIVGVVISTDTSNNQNSGSGSKEVIVQDCVDEVLRILKSKNQR